MPQRSLVLLAGAALLLSASSARAQCGGICLYEIGTPDSARSAAGAGARAEDAATTYWNPAGMTRLEGTHVHLGTVMGIIDTRFDDDGSFFTPPTTSGNDGGDLNDFVPLAGSYVVANPWDELRVGFGFSALYGGDVDYDNNWVGRSFVTEASLSVLNLGLNFAYPVTDWLSVGGGINFTYALFDLDARASNAAGAPTLEISRADDWSPAGTVGLLFTPREGTRFGLFYRTETSFDLEGDLDIPVGFTLDFQSEMNLPQGVNLSVFHRLGETVDLFGDVGWSDWSQFSYQPIDVGPATIPVDRDWRDTWRIAAGARLFPAETIALSTGISYDSSPVRDSKRLPDIPVGHQVRFSLGGSARVAENITIGLGYSLLYSPGLEADDVELPGGAATLNGDWDPTLSHFVSLDFSFHFGGPNPLFGPPRVAKKSGRQVLAAAAPAAPARALPVAAALPPPTSPVAAALPAPAPPVAATTPEVDLCSTARGDLRVLHSERAYVEEQRARGAGTVEPSRLVAGMLGGSGGPDGYAARLDAAIADIEATCRSS
ncbi:MAG: outer membrane protein transport protein [Myxococcota bacterium]|nr:outer membrane protein transport protein [Myxococcota bacterium]